VIAPVLCGAGYAGVHFVSLVDVTKGGLVVYGSVLAGVPFGIYYLIRGAQTFVRTGGVGAEEATRLAETAARQITFDTPTSSGSMSILPTWTPQIECADFRVSVPNAIVREQPNSSGTIITGYEQGTIVCVVRREPPDGEWYLIDLDPETRRLNEAYMNEEVVEPVNPTPTPSRTFTPLPTVTLAPTLEGVPTNTPNPDFRPTIPLASGNSTANSAETTLNTLSPRLPTVTTTPPPSDSADEGLPNG
jgi:hypothetical protein